ncbi:MAG: VWA domain-containing protein [Campylobacter sp.]|nr:VWA domain-containing protein [Campylobacter sp.]
MGGGSYSSRSFADYSISVGKFYDASTKRISGQMFDVTHLKETLNPKGKIRECCNSEEHPNTVPVILALDVTGSMGDACKETAEALSQIMDTLYSKFKDVEVCVMGVGDFECDDAPLQVSQFESDVRVAQQLDQIWMEHGGGGNRYESYTAPWLFGLYRTKLDAYDKQGRKGIIITMGDEPLNPDLPENAVKSYLGTVSGGQLGSLDTEKLYAEASKKFDIFHIAVDDSHNAYSRYKTDIKESFGKVLGQRLRVSTINELSGTICDCIEESIKGNSGEHLTEDNATIGVVAW